ncbi:transposase, partial [Pseudonocardia sp. EV170527-09]
MDATIPWATWVGVIEPRYYQDKPGKTGRKAKPIETMLRMYLLQAAHIPTTIPGPPAVETPKPVSNP